MTLPCPGEVLVRGGTVQWFTNFYDGNDEIVQPAAATIVINYPVPGGVPSVTEVAMTPPGGAETRWSAQWDSRGAGTGIVYWSIHSTPGPPFGVEDGSFEFQANPANLVTFT